MHRGRQSLVEGFRERPFRRAVIVLGPPRGGTTIVSRCIGQHSGVQSVIEPFQRRRGENYLETDPASLCADFGLHPDPGGCLLVKETFTRHENVDTTFELMDKLTAEGTASTLVYVCRSPIASFNSQVQASREQWARQNTFSQSEQSLKVFLHSVIRNSLYTLFEPVRCQRLLVFYQDFCSQPEAVLQHVMATVGLPFEQGQITLDSPSQVMGGDPGARLRKQVEPVDDDRAVEVLPEKVRQSRVGESALALHDVVQQLVSGDRSQEEARLQLREVMQSVSKQHFPALHSRFLKLTDKQDAGN